MTAVPRQSGQRGGLRLSTQHECKTSSWHPSRALGACRGHGRSTKQRLGKEDVVRGLLWCGFTNCWRFVYREVNTTLNIV
eukprot:scaffold776_cov347-Pavlova_lutheri.AAC.45